MTGLFCVVVACGRGTPSLEERSEELDLSKRTKPEVGLVLRPLPDAPPAPEGVESGLWEDLHWLPGTVVGISGTGPKEVPTIARWLFSQPEANVEACRALQRGLDRGYAVEWETPPQSFVLIGRVALSDVVTCAKTVAAAFGGEAQVDAGALRLRLDDGVSVVRFFERGGWTVAVVDDGRMGSPGAGSLAESRTLVSLLASTDIGQSSWAASSRDMTSAVLGVPSRGYSLYASDAGHRMRVRVEFSAAQEAMRALAKAEAVVANLEASTGLDLAATFERDGRAVSSAFSLEGLEGADPETLQKLQTALSVDAAP